jgi:hypothetical protein
MFTAALETLEGEESLVSAIELLDPEGPEVAQAARQAPQDIPPDPSALPEPEKAVALEGAPEVRHNMPTCEVKLIYATKWYATHRGTGEMRMLPDPPDGCVWALAFHPKEGILQAQFSIYDPSTETYSGHRHAGQVFKLRLHRFEETPSNEVDHLPKEELGFAICDSTTSGAALRTEQERKH